MYKKNRLTEGRSRRGFLSRTAAEVPKVLSLALPVIIGLTASALVGVADTIMIAPLGTEAMAAASLTTSFMIILYTVTYGIVSIVHIRIAQAEGAGDPAGVSNALYNGVILAGVLGFVSVALMIAAFPALRVLGVDEDLLSVLWPYWIAKSFVVAPFVVLSVYRGLFNATNRPWVSTTVAFAAVAINIPVSLALIHGFLGWPGIGLVGAGVGSFVAQASALGLAYAYFRMQGSLTKYRRHRAFKLRTMTSTLRDGLPVAISNLGEGGAYAAAGLLLGFFGAIALAANQVVHAIGAIMYMLPMGMTSAVAIRTGQAFGAREFHRLRAISFAATGIVLAWMGVFSIFLLIFRSDIAATLSSDPVVIPLASLMFLTVAFSQFADGLQSAALGALRGLVDVRVPTLITIVAYWAVGLPAACVLAFTLGFGPNAIWIGYGLGILISAIALQIRFWIMTRASRLMQLK